MTLRRVADPAEYLVSLAEAKNHMRLDGITGHDDRITRAIAAATSHVEQITGRALVSQRWEKRLDAFPVSGGAIELARPPVAAIVSVTYYDIDGVQQTLAPDAMELDAQPETAWLIPAYGYVWPETQDRINAVQILFTAGWASAGVVPADIRGAVLLLTEHFFRNTSAVTDRTNTEVPMGVDMLLAGWRTMRFA